MSSSMQGMDTDQARETSGRMDANAAQAAGVCNSLYARLSATSWVGPDMDRMMQDMASSFVPESTNAAETLRDQARVLAAHADRQDAASA